LYVHAAPARTAPPPSVLRIDAGGVAATGRPMVEGHLGGEVHVAAPAPFGSARLADPKDGGLLCRGANRHRLRRVWDARHGFSFARPGGRHRARGAGGRGHRAAGPPTGARYRGRRDRGPPPSTDDTTIVRASPRRTPACSSTPNRSPCNAGRDRGGAE